MPDIIAEIGLGDSTAVAEPEYPAPTLSGQRRAADEADPAEPVELSRNDSEDAGDKPGIISPGYYDSESSTDSIREDDSKGDADSSIADTLS